jgi:hypothetical protein
VPVIVHASACTVIFVDYAAEMEVTITYAAPVKGAMTDEGRARIAVYTYESAGLSILRQFESIAKVETRPRRLH